MYSCSWQASIGGRLLQPVLFGPTTKSIWAERILSRDGAKSSAGDSARLCDEGRNSVYLAQLGWEVWGFDPADAAVRLVINVPPDVTHCLGIRRSVCIRYSADRSCSAGRAFDPCGSRNRLLSWGMVVMEVVADYVGRNGMLKMFDAQIKRYESSTRRQIFTTGRKSTSSVLSP